MRPSERCAYFPDLDSPRCTALGTVRLLGLDQDPVPGGIYCEDHARELCAEYLEKVQKSWSYLPLLPAYDLCDDAGGVRLIVTGLEAALREAPACTCDHEDTICSDTCRSPLHALRHCPPAPRGWEVADTSVAAEEEAPHA